MTRVIGAWPNSPRLFPRAPTLGLWWYTRYFTVAGDGYFSLNYNISGSATTEHCDIVTDSYGVVYNHETKTSNASDEFHLLRVASDGTSQDLPLYTAPSSSSSTDNIDRVQAQVDCGVRPLPGGCTESMTGQGSDRYWRDYSAIITDADQGVLLLWTEIYSPPNGGAQTNTAKLTHVLGGQPGPDIPLQGLASPQQDQTMKLYLQLQNGDFVAIRNYNTLLAFNAATGQIHWTKPVTSYWTTPLYALADGTMVYREGYSNPQLVTVDAGGNELSRVADPKIVQKRA